MYKAPSKRKKRTQLFFIYSLMVVSVVAIVAILVLLLLGYRFNRFDGKVEQGGLVQFDSRPSGATVTVDNATLANRTASRITLTTGNHTVTIAKDGYTTWKKDVTVKPATILWLDYALLLPLKPKTTALSTNESVTSSVASPDRKLLAYVGKESQPTFYVVPVNDDKPVIDTITLDAKYYTAGPEGATQSFSVVAWDKDNRHVMVKHAYDNDKSEYIRVDMRGGDEPKNITRDAGIDILSLECDYDDANLLYVLTANHDLRRVNIGNSTISGPIATNVASFAQADRSTITYSTLKDSATDKRSVAYFTEGAEKPRVMRTVAMEDTDSLGLVIGKYYGEQYMVFYQGNQVEIYKGDISGSDSTSGPTLKIIQRFSTNGPVTNAMFSPDEKRFIAFQSAGAVDVYDLELLKHTSSAVNVLAGRQLVWINRFHYATTTDGTFTYYDFDGTNATVVAKNVTNMPALFSENGKYMYHFATTDTGTALVQTKMTAN